MRKLAKVLAGNKEYYASVGKYYRNVDRIQKMLWDMVVGTIVTILLVVGMGWFIINEFSKPWEGYVADKQVNGVLYDTDGDGDMYHWHDADITTGVKECDICR